jgi:hypothetical protein
MADAMAAMGKAIAGAAGAGGPSAGPAGVRVVRGNQVN